MEKEEMIRIGLVCSSYQAELSFIEALVDAGLIEATIIDEELYIGPEHVSDLERMIRLHYEMDINVEGIETITYILHRMREMQEEMNALRNKLRFFEDL